MARAVFRMSVEHGERFKRLSRELKAAGEGDLKRQLNREIRKAGKPVVADVQRAVRNVRVSSSKGGHAAPDTSTGLRRRVAAATKLEVQQRGIRIKVAGKKVDPEYGRRLSKYLDALPYGKFKRWRHPVFGRWDVPESARQQKGSPYFAKTIRKHTRDFRKAILAAMDDVENKIT